jgi:hypothetical protein
MQRLVLVTHPFDDGEMVQAAVAAIQAAGSVSYTDASGATVSVTVGDVTVESVPE